MRARVSYVFWNRPERLLRASPFNRRRDASGRYTYPCPGHIGHIAMSVGDEPRRVGMFERWVERSEKAKGLYWRTHPHEAR